MQSQECALGGVGEPQNYNHKVFIYTEKFI